MKEERKFVALYVSLTCETSIQHGIEVGRLLEPGRFQEYSGSLIKQLGLKAETRGSKLSSFHCLFWKVTRLEFHLPLNDIPDSVANALQNSKIPIFSDSSISQTCRVKNVTRLYSSSFQLREWRKIVVPNRVCLSGSGTHLLVYTSLIEKSQIKFQFQMNGNLTR